MDHRLAAVIVAFVCRDGDLAEGTMRHISIRTLAHVNRHSGAVRRAGSRRGHGRRPDRSCRKTGCVRLGSNAAAATEWLKAFGRAALPALERAMNSAPSRTEIPFEFDEVPSP